MSFYFNNSLLTATILTVNAGPNTANMNLGADWGSLNGNVTTVGTNGGPSYYGTYDQSGNVWEFNSVSGVAVSLVGIRGGHWGDNASLLSAATGFNNIAPGGVGNSTIGFRIASRFSTLNPLNLQYFVNVGDAGNVNDSTGLGGVNYIYAIGIYTVTNCEYVQFLNSVAKKDTFGLYNSNMMYAARGGIIRSGTTANWTYSLRTNMGNKPVNYINWFDCARYCNWLHNNKPIGDQTNITTEDGAYTLNGANDSTTLSVAINSGAKYHIPTANEWYKAAYYKGGGTNAGYWQYATQSNVAPTEVSANSIGNGPEVSNYSC